MARLRVLFITAVGLATPFGAAQEAPTESLFDVISRIPWSAEKDSPTIAVCQNVAAHGTTLSELHRKRVVFGGMTAIVPTRMLTLDTNFAEAPNLYDGLPREAKILFLLSLFSNPQWKKASTDGISLSDCRGEQVAVMQSILPNPMRLNEIEIVSQNSWRTASKAVIRTLSDRERGLVRLKVVRRVELSLSMNNGRSITGTTIRERIAAGTRLPSLIEDRSQIYGHQVKIESENVLRKSQLDFGDSKLDVKIAFKKSEPVDGLIQRVSEATGLEIYTDPHYSSMDMVEWGSSAAARDVLRGIAMGVCGTYRKVGSAYVLTSDLQGVGAHQARMGAWKTDIDLVVREREKLWRSQIAKKSGLAEVGFLAGAGYETLTQAERDNMEANANPRAPGSFIDTSQASAPVLREMQAFNQKLDMDRVGIDSSYRFEFVIPSGVALWPSGWLGKPGQFDPNPYQYVAPDGTAGTLPVSSASAARAVILKANTGAEAKRQVERAAKAGFHEIWLEASSPEVLREGVKVGSSQNIIVGMAARPWSTASNDPDRSITGLFGSQLDDARDAYLAMQSYWPDISAFAPVSRPSMAPLDPAWPVRRRQIQDMSEIPGLSTVAILDPFLSGYAKERERGFGSQFYSPPMDALLGLGYSDGQRMSFLKSEKVDPLDLEDDSFFTGVDTFDIWGGSSSLQGALEQWFKVRGSWMSGAIVELLAGIKPKSTSIFIGGQPMKGHLPPTALGFLYRWQPGSPLPSRPDDYGGFGKAETAASDLTVFPLVDSNDSAQAGRVAVRLREAIEKSGKPVVVDFSTVKESQLDRVIRLWFTANR